MRPLLATDGCHTRLEPQFITTVPNAHIRKYHPNIDVGKASQDRFDASGQRKTVALLSAGSSSTGSASN